MRILVTGAAGFAGRHMTDFLQREGHDVYGISRGALPDGLPGVVGDLSEPATAEQAIATFQPDGVIHLAAQTPANSHTTSNAAWLQTNPVMTLHVLDTVRRFAPQARVLVVGSSAVYGHVSVEQLPIGENTPLLPCRLYGVSKAAQELVAFQQYAEHGLQVIRARPFNLVGPGEPRSMLTSVLAAQVAAIVRGEQQPVIRVRHLVTARDYTDIRDAVRAYALLLQAGQAGAAYNVCSGVATPLRDVLRSLLESAGRNDIDVIETHPQPTHDDILVQSGSNARLHARTGWQPTLSLATSLADLLQAHLHEEVD